MRFRVASLFLATLALVGCPRLPAPDGCTPSATECFDTVENASPAQRTPRVCSQTQRQTFVELGGAPCGNFGEGVVCCRTQGRRGRPVHACVPATACIPESAQGGALSTPAELARKRAMSFDEVIPEVLF